MILYHGESADSARESIRGQLEQARARIVELENALHSAALQYAHHDPEHGIYHGPFAVLKQTKENSNG